MTIVHIERKDIEHMDRYHKRHVADILPPLWTTKVEYIENACGFQLSTLIDGTEVHDEPLMAVYKHLLKIQLFLS